MLGRADVVSLDEARKLLQQHLPSCTAGKLELSLEESQGRICAEDIPAPENLPPYPRSTMDGYAVAAASTFGASEGNPAYLTVKGAVSMGRFPDFTLGPGEAARISTGGMLPEGADSVVMMEYTEAIDDTTLEVYHSVAPGHNLIVKGEDFKKNQIVLSRGQRLRAQETGLLAAFGKKTITVYKKPVVGIIATGDEVVSIDKTPGPAQIRDINTYSLTSLVKKAGGIPVSFGIVEDDYDHFLLSTNR